MRRPPAILAAQALPTGRRAVGFFVTAGGARQAEGAGVVVAVVGLVASRR